MSFNVSLILSIENAVTKTVRAEDENALVRKRPLWQKLYRSWSLSQEAKMDVKWHAGVLRDIRHEPMESAVAVQLLDDAKSDTSDDRSVEKFDEGRRS